MQASTSMQRKKWQGASWDPRVVLADGPCAQAQQALETRLETLGAINGGVAQKDHRGGGYRTAATQESIDKRREEISMLVGEAGIRDTPEERTRLLNSIREQQARAQQAPEDDLLERYACPEKAVGCQRLVQWDPQGFTGG